MIELPWTTGLRAWLRSLAVWRVCNGQAMSGLSYDGTQTSFFPLVRDPFVVRAICSVPLPALFSAQPALDALSGRLGPSTESLGTSTERWCTARDVSI